LDYQTHMQIIAPVLSYSFCIQLSSTVCADLTQKALNVYKEKKNMRLLQICHHLTAAIKAQAMELQYVGQDELRQACGGAGVLMASGVASNWADCAPALTFEGTTTVLY